eukprot:07716_3
MAYRMFRELTSAVVFEVMAPRCTFRSLIVIRQMILRCSCLSHVMPQDAWTQISLKLYRSWANHQVALANAAIYRIGSVSLV